MCEIILQGKENNWISNLCLPSSLSWRIISPYVIQMVFKIVISFPLFFFDFFFHFFQFFFLLSSVGVKESDQKIRNFLPRFFQDYFLQGILVGNSGWEREKNS